MKENREMFNLKLDYKPKFLRWGLFFNSKIEGDVISIADEDNKKNLEYYEDEEFFQKEKDICESKKDLIDKYDCIISFPWDFYHYTTDISIGNRTSITKSELVKLLNLDEKENDGYHIYKIKDLKDAEIKFRPCYDVAIDTERAQMFRLVEEATKIVENKNLFERVINYYDEGVLINKSKFDELSKVYFVNNELLLQNVLKKRFKKPQKIEIETSIKGSPVVWSEGHGRDFSYEFTDTYKNFYVYAEEGTKIDTGKKYSAYDIVKLKENKNLIVVDKSELSIYSNIKEFKESVSNVTEEELYKTAIAELNREKLVEDYNKYMRYYNIAKIDIETRIKELRSENDKQIDKKIQENEEGNKTIELMNENEELKF